MINNSIITTSNVNVEVNLTSTAQLNLGNANSRALLSGYAGSISMGNLRGKKSVQMIASASIDADAADPDNASANIAIYANGWMYQRADPDPTPTISQYVKWHVLAPTDNGANYEVYVSNTAGNTPSSNSAALNTWLALTTSRYFGVIRTTPGTKSCTLNITFRRISGSGNDAGANQQTHTTTLSATVV